MARNQARQSVAEAPWGRLLGFLRAYKGPLALALLARLVASAMFLALPAVVQRIVDTALAQRDMTRLNWSVLFLVLAFVILTLASITGNYFNNFVGERVVRDLRATLYEHLQRLSLRFFHERRVGELVSRMSSDVTVMRQMLTTNLVNLTRYVLTVAGAIIVMMLLNWRLTLFILITTPLVALLSVLVSRFAKRGGRRVQDELAGATVIAQESFQNIRDVKGFVREEHETNRYVAAVDRTLRAALYLARVRAVMGPVVHFLFLLNIALILWYGGREVVANRLSSGELVAFLVYVTIVGQMFSEIGTVYSQTQETLGATERIFELLDLRPDIQDNPDAFELEEVRGRITFDNVSFNYEERQPVLYDINLEIAPGEILALVGPSGSGKSTMFNLIPRFYDVTSGAVRVDGHDVRDVTQASLRAQIGIVPQETLLFGGSIRENILYGRLDASEEEVFEAARAANAHQFILGLPDGYDTAVGERGVRLSGGQRQRVAIARAILKDPRILLLDEATSSLDNESEHLVQEALERLMQGRTTVMIAHRLSTIRVAHRIAVMQEGRIVELGSHEALLALNGLYAHLYEMQFREADPLAEGSVG